MKQFILTTKLLGYLALSLLTSACTLDLTQIEMGIYKDSREMANALSTHARCYRLSQTTLSSQGSDAKEARSLWCYYSPENGLQYIFNIDRPELEGALFVIVFPDSEGRPSEIVHGIRRNGQLDFNRTSGRTPSPVQAPLQENQIQGNPVSQMEFSSELAGHFLAVRQWALRSVINKTPDAKIYHLSEGTQESFLEDYRKPWRGWYWPFGSLTESQTSALHSFDHFLFSTTGVLGKSVQWENFYHPKEKIGGHCNGWAAASILYTEPPAVLSATALNPHPASLEHRKAVLIASNFCVDFAFYGKRMYTNSPSVEENTDISPDLFHKVIVYNIKNLKRAVAFDYYASSWVDNHVASGYQFTAQKVENEENAFDVVMKLRSHKYTSSSYQGTGVSTEYDRYYSYRLYVDKSGEVIGGIWKSNNPDFLWIPLAPKDCDDNSENPHLTRKHVEAFVFGQVFQEPNLTDTKNPGQTPEQTPSQDPTQTPVQTPIQAPTQDPSQTPTQTPIQDPSQTTSPESTTTEIWLFYYFLSLMGAA